MGFTRLLTNTTISEAMSHTISSQCNSTDGVIITPYILSTTGTLGRMLTGKGDMDMDNYAYYESFIVSVKDRISYYL